MSIDRLKNLGNDILGVAKEGYSKASTISTDIIDGIKDGTIKSLTSTQQVISDAGTYAIRTVEGTQETITTKTENAINSFDDGIQGFRNQVANDLIKKPTDIAAEMTGAFAELTLFFGSGIIFYPFVAGLGAEVAKELVHATTDPLYKAIRSKKISFVDLHIHNPNGLETFFGDKKNVLAIIYMPQRKDADREGLALIDEQTLSHLIQQEAVTPIEKEVFSNAIEQIRRKKVSLGLSLPSPTNN